VQADRAETHAE